MTEKMKTLPKATMDDTEFEAKAMASLSELNDSIDADLEMYKEPPVTIQTAKGYEDLLSILGEAYNQSVHGKGKERHAGTGKPFDRQPIMEIGRMTGLGYPTGQAQKKIQEAVTMFNRGNRDAALRELLGTIVYTAAAIKLIREH